ncbi:uncharacterized protein L199_007773 [Kwoniella botswanensis]|uniref:uncharacterized protein n=1 Tax=Kwoniella botswanensis TaxID=1268659 RepID=UPI00315C89C3
MCSYFGKSLYRDLVLDKRNAWNVCLGINWDLDSVDEKGVDAGSMRAQREDTIEYPREGILKRLAQVLKLKRPSIQQITQPSEPEKTPFPPSIPTPFGLDTLSIHRRKVELLNHVQYLYINDLESAAYVCRALGTDIVSRSEPKDQPCSYPHPPARTFKGVQTIALGFDLMKSETSFFGSKIGGLLMGMSWDQIGFFDPYQHPNPENTLHTLACTLQPKQVCSTWCRGLESPWDCTFFWKMKDLVAGWKLESFTWHSTGGLSDPGRSAGLYLSDETRAVTSFFPPNIPRIRAFNHPTFTDHCNGSGESCECKKALRDILIHLTLEDWSDEIRNEERKVDLIRRLTIRPRRERYMLDQCPQLLEFPKEARARIIQLQSHANELTIDGTTAGNIFANIKQLLSASYESDLLLFNKVEQLFIEDMEGAQALAQALEDCQLSKHLSGVIKPTIDIFKNVTTISLGSKLLERLVKSYSTGNLKVKRIMETIGHALQPTHVCLAKPLIDPTTQDGLWDIYLFGKLSPLMNSGRLRSFTAHGFWYYNDTCFPSSLDHFNIIFSDCPSPINSGPCDCYDKLRDALDSIIDMDCGEVDSELQKGKGVNLINLPHISPDMVTLQALVEMKIQSEGSFPVYNMRGKKIDLTKGFQASWEWFETKFKVINKKDAKPCVCCGKV